jgi:hypothetical protein
VEKVEGLTRVRFVAAGGWETTGERPAGDAQGGTAAAAFCPAVLRPGRGRGGARRLGGRVELLDGTGPGGTS